MSSHPSQTSSKHPALQRLFAIIEMGYAGDFVSIAYDVINTITIVGNLIISLVLTFSSVEASCGNLLRGLEAVTYIFFTFDFICRALTSSCRYPKLSSGRALVRYLFSFMGLIDLFSFLPYYLPVFFPGGAAAFRMIRVARIFRLFRINAYYDSLNVITQVLISKKQQLLSSVFIILILMLGSSLCMYGLEHEAQPDAFQNAFSGIWWSVSALLTVGYGDIYPITTAGRIFGIITAFLGVGMVAVPTGIISAGFVEQYSIASKKGEYSTEKNVHFIRFVLTADDNWCGKRIGEITIPKHMLISAVQRNGAILFPRTELVLEPEDLIVIGADGPDDDHWVDLQKITLGKHHPWAGMRIRDLDISRQTVIVLITRNQKSIVPRGETMLEANDIIMLYSRKYLRDAQKVDL